MRYATVHRSARKTPLLEIGVAKQQVGSDCRGAGLAFLAGVAAGWDKLDLALWLTGPYARATRHAPRAERLVSVPCRPAPIASRRIEQLVTHVRGQVLASLEKAALERGYLDFADDALERGLVRIARCPSPCDDEEGAICFVPVDSPRISLRDRVQSLFAADYLSAPYEYADLFVCHRCEDVIFDEQAKQLGVCRSHRVSGVVPRNAG